MTSLKNATRAIPNLVPGTNVRWGHETTPSECRARARWEREQAESLKNHRFGSHLADGHQRIADGYERTAKVREEILLKMPAYVPGTKTPFGAERTAEDYRARAKWERERAQLLMHHVEGPARLLAPNHLQTSLGYEAAAGQIEIDSLASNDSAYDYQTSSPSL